MFPLSCLRKQKRSRIICQSYLSSWDTAWWVSGGDALGRGAVTHLSRRLGYGCEAGDWNSRQFLGSTVGETKSVGLLHFYFLKLLCDLNLDAHSVPDLTLIQQEVDALEELSRPTRLQNCWMHICNWETSPIPHSWQETLSPAINRSWLPQLQRQFRWYATIPGPSCSISHTDLGGL